MAGPNDIGVLRGIIGDGTSMNDEDIRTKAYGKRPGAEKRLENVKVPKMDAAKEFTYFKKDNKNPMDVMKKFNLGQNRNTNSNNVPHVVNKILRDKYGLNAEQWEQRTIMVRPGSVEAPKPSDILKTKQDEAAMAEAEGKRQIAEAKTKASLDAIEQQRLENKDVRMAEALRQQKIAELQSKKYAAQLASKEFVEKLDPGYTLVQPPTISMPVRNVELNWPWTKGKPFMKITKGKGKRTYALAYTEQYVNDPNKSVMENLKGQVMGGTVRPQLIKVQKPGRFGQGFRSFAGDVADTLGKTFSSGTLVSPFRQQDTRDISLARLELQAYVQYLQKKYGTKDLGNVNLLGKERYKMESLKQKLGEKQRVLSQGEFLSGTAAMPMLMTSQPRMNIQPYTQTSTPRIAFSELGQGIAYPESSARLGVSQGLTAYDQNKWDVVLSKNNPADKITNILGKKPDPTGSGETASARIKRLSGL